MGSFQPRRNPLYTLGSHIALLRGELRQGRRPKMH